MIAKYLNISIKDTEEGLKDGVILCQLTNEMKRNSVRKIMMPQVIPRHFTITILIENYAAGMSLFKDTKSMRISILHLLLTITVTL